MRTITWLSQMVLALALAGAVQACAAGGGQTANDPLARQVRTALNDNRSVTSSNYQVTTAGSEVRLRGVVPTPFEQQQALTTARRVPGVTNVINDIDVAPPVHVD